jgi:hypothetical protein
VNQIKQVFARRAEAEDLLKLLTAHPSSYEKTVELPLQNKRRYSIVDIVEGVVSEFTATTVPVTTAFQATGTVNAAAVIESSSEC